jgi:apolipoprotein N-acyltransferase
VTAFYDSAFVIAPDGDLRDRYDKTHLVPFGEYLPFRALIGRFVRAIATGAVAGDVSAGARPRAVLTAPRLGIPICYELIFPDLVRRIADDGAQVLLGITNDAWYGRTGAPYQFLAMTALRSAETGTWTARAANTGVSALIDARGRVTQATPIFEQDLLVARVPLRPPELGPTLYARFGDLFAGACTVATVLGLARALAGPRRREPA